MQFLQILLVLSGLGVSTGGVWFLIRGAQKEHSGTPRPYVPLGMVAVGLIVAYRAWSDFGRLDGQDVLVMFAFVFALLALLGLRFFIVDRVSHRIDTRGEEAAERVEVEPLDAGSDGSWRA